MTPTVWPLSFLERSAASRATRKTTESSRSLCGHQVSFFRGLAAWPSWKGRDVVEKQGVVRFHAKLQMKVSEEASGSALERHTPAVPY